MASEFNARAIIMGEIADEQDIYEQYIEVCARYKIQPEELVGAIHQNRISILEKLLGMMPANLP